MSVDLADIPADEAVFYGAHAYGRSPEQISVWDLFGEIHGRYVGRHRAEREPLAGIELDIWIDFFLADAVERSMMAYLYN